MMITPHEKNLIAQILRGNRNAEQELFAGFDRKIIRKVRLSIGMSNADWKDIVSEIQLALLDSLRNGRFDVQRGSSLGSYIYGITMNKVRDYFKQQEKRKLISTNSEQSDNWSVNEADELEQKEIHNLLRSLLENLKLKYKEVLYLRYYKEYSISEISQIIGLPPRRVSERIHYAVKLLKKECEKKKLFSIFCWLVLIGM